MIEFALLQNGGTHAKIRRMSEQMSLPDATLAEMHEHSKDVIRRQLKHSVVAEEVGFHYTFFTEHHFQPEGAELSPNPVLMGVAVAMVTENIRIGQLANIIPGHHPVRLAEQVATLDILSNGRAEMGWGRGGQSREWEVFGQVYGSSIQDDERNRAYVEECYDIIIKAWTEPSFSHQGQFYTLPTAYTAWGQVGVPSMTEAYFSQPGVGRTVEQVLKLTEGSKPLLREMTVHPQPLQSPYPQGWAATTSLRSITFAAERGLNAFFNLGGPDQAKKDMELYYSVSEKAGWPDRLGRGEFKYGWDSERRRGLTHLRAVHIHDDKVGNEPAFSRGLEHFANYFGSTVAQSGLLPKDKPFTEALTDGIKIVGNREQVIQGFLDLASITGDGDFLALVWLDVPGLSEEEHEEQIRIFGEDIMPALERELGGAAPRIHGSRL